MAMLPAGTPLVDPPAEGRSKPSGASVQARERCADPAGSMGNSGEGIARRSTRSVGRPYASSQWRSNPRAGGKLKKITSGGTILCTGVLATKEGRAAIGQKLDVHGDKLDLHDYLHAQKYI
jgi:hypothetical protein